ncbi:DUF6082 family protein [Streptomyces sp. NPDC048248]|uniref:DUF6082 family protein n=1 Tax=Streptomyces sp. NPDC048248 TaxID=3365523 RepID=UPI00371E2F30
MNSSRRRVPTVLTLCAIALIGLVALVVVTPIALTKIAPVGYDWGRLSDISQVYGAVSILISSVALAGVVLSLGFQLRQARTGDEQSVRDSHLQLTALALVNPELLRAWSPPAAPVTLVRHQQHLVASLVLGELLQRFRIGHLSADKLTVKLDGHFRHEIAREQWQREGTGWLRTMNAGDKRDQRFVHLVQARYDMAVAAGPPIAATDAFLPPEAPPQPQQAPRCVPGTRPRRVPPPRTPHGRLRRARPQA